MFAIRSGAVALSLFAIATIALAVEPDELRERTKAIKRDAAELAEREREVDVEKYQRRSTEVLEQAERRIRQRPENRNIEFREKKERLNHLLLEVRELEKAGGRSERLADVRHETEKIARELYELTQDTRHEGAAPNLEAARRFEHMRAAIEHLHRAGLQDIAEHVKKRAETTEREMREHQQHHDGDPIHKIMKQLDEMRHEFGRLRDEVNELKRRRD